MPKKDYSIGELISEKGLFCDGDWIESKDQDVHGNVRLIQLSDIGDGGFLDKSKKFLTIDKANELKCTFLKGGDILMARMPDPIGRACIFPGFEYPCVTSVDVAIIRPENKLVSNDWLKFKINSLNFRHNIKGYITGTTRKRISRSNLEKIRFELPVINDQVNVSNILSFAESLIVKRKETLRLLDDILRSKFIEMFGDTNNEFDGKPLGAVANIEMGQSPDGRSYNQSAEGMPLLNGPAEFGRKHPTVEQWTTEPTRLCKVGDILFCVRGATVGKMNWADKQYCIGRGLASISTKSKISNFFIYKFLQLKLSYFLRIGTGSTFININKTQISQLKLPKITAEKEKLYTSFAMIIDELKENCLDSLSQLQALLNAVSQMAFNGELAISAFKLEETRSSLSAFEDKPELAQAAIDAINRNLSLQYSKIGEFSMDEKINSKLKQLEQEKLITGSMPLDIDYLKHVLREQFVEPFKAEKLQQHLSDLKIEYSYDQLVTLIFELLRGKKSFLKQGYLDVSKIPSTNLSGEENRFGLYLMLSEQ